MTGLRGVKPITLGVRVAALRAYRAKRDVPTAIREAMAKAVPIVTDGMVAAHLQGRLRSLDTASAVIGKRLALANAYDGATDFLQRRLDLSEQDVASLADLYGPTAVSVTGNLTGLLERKCSEAIAEAVRSGTHTSGGIALLRGAFDAAGVTPGSDFALETLFRTQVQTAYSAGRWNANQDPAIQEILWGYRYATAHDDRVRPTHAAMDGVTAPKDDPIWHEWTPPCGWNCRCTTLEIFHGDSEAVHIPPPPEIRFDGQTMQVVPDEGFGFNAGQVYRDLLPA